MENPDSAFHFEIHENKDNPVFYDPLGAVDDTSTYKAWRPGLNKYYPKEVHIFHAP